MGTFAAVRKPIVATGALGLVLAAAFPAAAANQVQPEIEAAREKPLLQARGAPAEIDTEAARIAQPLVGEFQAAWNAHELGRFGAIFWPDSAFIHRGGGLIEGGDEIRDYHAKLHTHPLLAASRIEMTIERARRLAADVVLVTTDSKGWLGGKVDERRRPKPPDLRHHPPPRPMADRLRAEHRGEGAPPIVRRGLHLSVDAGPPDRRQDSPWLSEGTPWQGGSR